VSVPHQQVVVSWERTEDAEKVCRTWFPSFTPFFYRIRGCAKWAGNVCTIVAPDFKSEDEREKMATLGHELKHCFDGSWHK
jgi:hypothetical protein